MQVLVMAADFVGAGVESDPRCVVDKLPARGQEIDQLLRIHVTGAARVEPRIGPKTSINRLFQRLAGVLLVRFEHQMQDVVTVY